MSSYASPIPVFLQLPVEVMIMILNLLPPSSIMDFFRSRKQTFRYASAVLGQNPPLQFHRYYTGTSKSIADKQMLMFTLLSQFPRSHGPELDRRWELISEIVFLAKYASRIPHQLISPTTMDVRAPLQSVDYSFGFEKLIAEIPDDIDAITVYMVELRGNLYMSGLEFVAKTTRQLVGL